MLQQTVHLSLSYADYFFLQWCCLLFPHLYVFNKARKASIIPLAHLHHFFKIDHEGPVLVVPPTLTCSSTP